MVMKFDKHPLVTEKDKHTTKIVNAYVVFELDLWPKNPLDSLYQKY